MINIKCCLTCEYCELQDVMFLLFECVKHKCGVGDGTGYGFCFDYKEVGEDKIY